MALAYRPPGVSITEVVNPTFQPFLGDPTSIVIVGPAAGYEAVTDYVQLIDDEPAVLSITDGINVTGLIVKSVDGSTTYTQGTATGGTGAAVGRPSGDYYISGNQIIRSMPTLIQNDEKIVVYYEINSDNTSTKAHQEEITLDSTTAVTLSTTSTHDTTIGIIVAQHKGIVDPSNYTIDTNLGTITIGAGSKGVYPALFSSSPKNALWVDYTDDSGVRQINEKVTMVAGVATVANTPAVDTDAANFVVRNTSDNTVTDAAFRFGSTSSSNGLASNDGGADFTLLVSHPSAYVFTIARAQVTTPNIPSGATVQVVYTATPTDYYVPTQVFNQSDVTQKYGPALDANGNVVSPVTLAAGLAFANGATDLVIQALFHTADGVVRTQGGIDTSSSADANNLIDWINTFTAMQDLTDVNVIVPLVSTGTGNYSDNLALNVFIALSEYINFMQTNNNQYMVGICGEDATVLGPNSTQLANAATLQAHATTLGSLTLPEVLTLISPSSFQYASSGGTSSNIGGQYVAAMVAGRLGSQEIQQSLTRKSLIGLTAINDIRSERDKNSDAASGLFVIENKRGVLRVRHAITVAVNDANTRLLSVIRTKGYMIDNVANVIDQQVIGNIIADDASAFTVQTLVEGELDSLVTEGAIVSYQDVQARLSSTDPSTIEVQFSYLPAFELDYINLVFSINTADNTISTASTTSGF